MEMFSLHFSPGTCGDVFTPFGTKALLQILEAPASEESIFFFFFFFVNWAASGYLMVLGHTVGLNIRYMLVTLSCGAQWLLKLQNIIQLTKISGTHPKSVDPKITLKWTLPYLIRYIV